MNAGQPKTKAIIVMGVSGTGKSTVGAALAKKLGWVFVDADDYHSEVNKNKMQNGLALTDADRAPWLARLRQLIEAHLQANNPMVLACSALKESYREILMVNLLGVKIVFLQGSPKLIAKRMQSRQHFMPTNLLASQFEILEKPKQAIVIDIAQPVEEMVEEIMGQLNTEK